MRMILKLKVKLAHLRYVVLDVGDPAPVEAVVLAVPSNSLQTHEHHVRVDLDQVEVGLGKEFLHLLYLFFRTHTDLGDG